MKGGKMARGINTRMVAIFGLQIELKYPRESEAVILNSDVFPDLPPGGRVLVLDRNKRAVVFERDGGGYVVAFPSSPEMTYATNGAETKVRARVPLGKPPSTITILIMRGKTGYHLDFNR